VDELTTLAIRARDGDRLALGAFIRRTQADVWRTCAHLGPAGQADDLTQDVYLRMMNALAHFRGESAAKTWLLSIARHVSIDAIRRRDRRRRLSERHRHDSSMTAAPNHVADFHDMLRVLDDDQRSAFISTQVLGLSYVEAAEMCECPVGTIRSRVARARSRLLDLLQDNEDMDESESASAE
jgi:RNA polymerase sigma-70 factor, ECF subfamily